MRQLGAGALIRGLEDSGAAGRMSFIGGQSIETKHTVRREQTRDTDKMPTLTQNNSLENVNFCI